MTERPPGPRGLPVVGNTIGYGRDPVGFRNRCLRRYGDVVALNVLGMDMYLVADPALVESVLVSESTAYGIPSFTKERMAPVLGEGMLMADGERWQRARTAVQPGFSRAAMATYAPIVVEEARRLREQWTAGTVVDVGAAMRETTIRIILRVVFGPDLAPEEHGLVEALGNVVAPAAPHKQALFLLVPRWVPLAMNRRFRRGIATLESFIDERRATVSDGAGERNDLFSRFVSTSGESGPSLSPEEVRDEVMTLLVAGHATTAHALTFTWHLLGHHPDVDRQLADELAALDGSVSAGDVRDLAHTDCVLTESLRLFPPANEVRRAAARDVELGDYTVPKGTVVAMPMWPIHRDERWFDDPGEFRPSRWTEDLEERLPPFAYFPFGGGQRVCVAERFARLEALTILAVLGREHRLEPVGGGDLSVTSAVNLKPASPVEMLVRDR